VLAIFIIDNTKSCYVSFKTSSAFYDRHSMLNWFFHVYFLENMIFWLFAYSNR